MNCDRDLRGVWTWRSVRWGLSGFAALMLLGCSIPERSDLPVPVKVSIAASERLNPTEQGRPSPVVVRVYELSGSGRFQREDFFTLLGDLAAARNEEVVDVFEYVVMPGEMRVLRRRASLETRFIGVVAGFRDMHEGAWRALVSVPAPHRAGRLWSSETSPERQFRITVGERAVAISDVSGKGT